MKTIRYAISAALAAIACLAAALPVGAQDARRETGATPASAYVEAALRADPRLAARRASLDAARSSLDAVASKSPLVVSAGIGDASYSGASTSVPAGEAILGFGPWVEISAPDPVNATIKVSAPTVVPLGGSEAVVEPAISFKQSLERLFRKKPDIALLRSSLAVTAAEHSLEAAFVESASSALEALRDWAAAENDVAAAESAAAAAARDLSNALSLGLYSEGSVALSRLRNAVLATSLAVDKADRSLKRRRSAVAAIARMEPDAKPPEPYPAAYPDISRLEPASSLSVAALAAALEIERAAYRDEWERDEPSLGWTGSIALDAPSAAAPGAAPSAAPSALVVEPGIDASIGLSIAKDGLSGGASFGWRGAYGQPYVGVQFSWIPGDERVEASRAEAAAAALRSAEADYMAALADAAAALADLALESSIAEVDGRRLSAAYEEARLAVIELSELERAGLATLEELDEASVAMYAAASALEAAAWNRAIRAERVKLSWALPGGRP